MQYQQDRIAAIFTTNGDPLLDAANLDVAGFIDAIWRRDGVVPRVAIAYRGEHRIELLETAAASSGCAEAVAADSGMASAAQTLTASTVTEKHVRIGNLSHSCV